MVHTVPARKRGRLALVAVATLASLLLSACTGISPTGGGAGKVSKITSTELAQKLQLDDNPAMGVVIDLNDPETFKERHIQGAINIPYEQFEQNLSKVDPKKEIYLFSQSLLKMQRVANLLAIKGYPKVRYINGRVLTNAVLIDLNDPAEFSKAHIDGAKNIPLNELEKRFSEIPKGPDVIVYARNGKLATDAVVKLNLNGYESVKNLSNMAERADPPAVVIDVNDSKAFRASHIPGSINVPAADLQAVKSLDELRQKYPSLNPARETVIVDPDGTKGQELANALVKLGFRTVSYVEGGLNAWNKVKVTALTVDEVKAKLAAGAKLVDVRLPLEYEKGHVKDSILTPLQQLTAYYEELMPPGPEYIMLGNDNLRAAEGARLLVERGYKASYLDGGIRAWPDEQQIGPPPDKAHGLIFI